LLPLLKVEQLLQMVLVSIATCRTVTPSSQNTPALASPLIA